MDANFSFSVASNNLLGSLIDLLNRVRYDQGYNKFMVYVVFLLTSISSMVGYPYMSKAEV